MEIDRRLQVIGERNKPETWLFPDLKRKSEFQADAPIRLDTTEKREWAKQKYEQALEAHHAALGTRLAPGVSMNATFEDGELKFFVDETAVIEQIFVDEDEGRFVLAQWKLLASTYSVTEKTDGKKLANALRKIKISDNPSIVSQVVSKQHELANIEADIASVENDINEIIFGLYDLDDEAIRMVVNG